MKKKFKNIQILVYYDLPELVLVEDEVGTKYLCLLTNVDQETLKYFATAISNIRLTQFITGKIELRDIFSNPESNQYYSFENLEEIIEATLTEDNTLSDEYLPEVGFVYKQDMDKNEIILNEALEKNNAVVHLAISDSNDNFSVDADDMGDIVKLYQQIIEKSFKKIVSRENLNKKIYSIPSNYKLRAFAFSQSSFNIHLYSTSDIDLFGNTVIEMALKKFDEITHDYKEQEDYILSLRSMKGHTITSLQRLVKKLIDNDIKIKHKWYSPGQKTSHLTSIDKRRAEKIYEILTLSDELTEETRNFVGFFVQVDIERGTWRIFNNEDEKEYNGKASRELLQGIIVETGEYKLECIEIIEELKVAEREKIKYILQKLEKL